MFYVKFNGMFMVYFQTKLIIRLQVKYITFRTAILFLLCIMQEYDMKKVAYYLKIIYQKMLRGPITPFTKEVCASVMLTLLMEV